MTRRVSKCLNRHFLHPKNVTHVCVPDDCATIKEAIELTRNKPTTVAVR